MEENNTNKNNSNFKTVSNPGTYKTVYEVDNKPKKNSNFGRNVLIPFVSGIAGCAVVIGTCFGVPSIKQHILGSNSSNLSNTQSSNSKTTGTVDQVSLSNYSDTSVYAANKILPSIVGIKIEYNVTSMFSMFGNKQSSTATATGSGIIISDDGYILTNNHVVS